MFTRVLLKSEGWILEAVLRISGLAAALFNQKQGEIILVVLWLRIQQTMWPSSSLFLISCLTLSNMLS